MIHHLFIVHRAPWAVSEYVVPTAEEAARQYVKDNGMCSPARYTIPVWQDTTFAGYVRVNVVADAIVESLFIAPPPCHEPIPAPVVQPPPPPSAAQRFKGCPIADREVALMALEGHARSLGAKAEALRDHGCVDLADITIGQQTAVLAALDVLRELHKESANG